MATDPFTRQELQCFADFRTVIGSAVQVPASGIVRLVDCYRELVRLAEAVRQALIDDDASLYEMGGALEALSSWIAPATEAHRGEP